MIFVLDNYDSFTFNLVQYIGETGEEVQVRRNDQVTPEQIEEMKPRKIVISPGPCTPNEAGITLDLIRQLAGKIPILGVCLGHQAIGAAFGGRVIRSERIMHGKTLIMGLRHRELPVEGVQFHPESVLTPDGAKLIRNFLQ